MAEQRPLQRPRLLQRSLLRLCRSAVCAGRVRRGGKRGGAGKRGGGGEQASGPRAARRTGDRQAGDGLESDRAQRSERADRRSAAADLEGVRSATVGVGGRPSCGEEGGRQVRVARVALHRPVERHSSRDRAWAAKSRWGRGRWEVGRDSFPLSKAASRAAQLWVCHEKRFRLENGANWAAKFTPRGTTYVFVNVVVAPRYVARVQLGSGGLKSLCGIAKNLSLYVWWRCAVLPSLPWFVCFLSFFLTSLGLSVCFLS